jgi:hypothetical protein
MAKVHRTSSALLPTPPLLITESQEEFDRIRDGAASSSSYVAEVAHLVWQILRLRRCKAGVTNLAFHDASAKILGRLIGAGPDVARDWISDPDVEKKVSAALDRSSPQGLGETPEARPIRARTELSEVVTGKNEANFYLIFQCIEPVSWGSIVLGRDNSHYPSSVVA